MTSRPAAHWRHQVFAVAALVLPALALSIPSGYSWGSLLLCVLGLACARAWPSAWQHPALRTWVVAVALMGLLLSLDAWQTHPFKANTLDRPLKFALALLAIPAALAASGASVRTLRWGLWVGALAAAGTAFWQLQVLHWTRAWGYTNAIHFGNLALLLGVWSWLWARHEKGWRHWVGMLAALAGGYACIASESRGGWWVAPVLVALVFALEHRRPLTAYHAQPSVPHHGRYRVRLLLSVAAVLVLLGSQWHLVQTRANEAWQEMQLHQTTGASDNSIGQRLAHWKFAWRMGLAKPWTGWGEQGYQIEKNAQAERGDIPRVLHEFEHAHNEWLDMWAKRGTVGVLVLVLFFALPGHLYWRTWRQSVMQPPTPWQSAARTSALCGLVMVVGYVGFGLTQVMFAHNAGTMMYLFMNLLWLAPIAQASAEQRHRHGEQPQRQVDADPQPNAGQ